jgi:hypothetical protein
MIFEHLYRKSIIQRILSVKFDVWGLREGWGLRSEGTQPIHQRSRTHSKNKDDSPLKCGYVFNTSLIFSSPTACASESCLMLEKIALTESGERISIRVPARIERGPRYVATIKLRVCTYLLSTVTSSRNALALSPSAVFKNRDAVFDKSAAVRKRICRLCHTCSYQDSETSSWPNAFARRSGIE